MSEERPRRNFERFNTRREAFLAYQELCGTRKTPIWIEDDEVPCATEVDFNDWCWLPEKEDGRYRKSEYLKQYLGRDYT